MSDANIPDVKVAVSISGTSVAIFSFWRVELHPQDWQVTAALLDADTGRAVRACLLACVAELGSQHWKFVEGLPEEFGSDGAEEHHY